MKIRKLIVIIFSLGICQFHWQTICAQGYNKDHVTYEILKPGSGAEATVGQEVVIHEQMEYLDGTILYSSKASGSRSPIRFLLGGNQVIDGVDQGVQGMKAGEVRKVTVPPSLSERKGYPVWLSPDSTLLYTIELIEIIPPPEFPPLSARGKIIQQVGFDTITIEYERPSVRGRRIFGGLVPYDTLWKTGAGSGPRISFSGPVTIGNNAIASGVYALMTIPGRNIWTVILTTDTIFYSQRKDYEPEKEAARFQVKPEHTTRLYESFTIDVDVVPHNADIYLSWEHTQIKFSLITGTDEKVDKFVKESLLTAQSQNPDLYATAADYYFFGNKELEKALVLIDTAIKKGPKSWHYRLKMDILEKMNRNEEAIEVGQTGIKFVNETADKLGWDALTLQQSINQFKERIEDLNGSLEK